MLLFYRRFLEPSVKDGLGPVAGIKNLIAFYRDSVDVWHEED